METDAYCFHRTFEAAAPAAFQVDRHYLLYAESGALRLEAKGLRWTLPPARALSRRFAEETGMTWRQALCRMRMLRAVEALAGSQAPVTEIALSVGYNSLSAFNAALRDLVGMSPTQYRATFR